MIAIGSEVPPGPKLGLGLALETALRRRLPRRLESGLARPGDRACAVAGVASLLRFLVVAKMVANCGE
jgi:hypothetical protein